MFEPCPSAAHTQNSVHPQQTKETRDARGQRYKPARIDMRHDTMNVPYCGENVP